MLCKPIDQLLLSHTSFKAIKTSITSLRLSYPKISVELTIQSQNSNRPDADACRLASGRVSHRALERIFAQQ